MRAIQTNAIEGELFCKWLDSRMIRKNKNVLGAELGGTGSGKSYRDLRKAELWYQYHFKEPFPLENICFGVGATMRLISSGKLRKGELIIFEEAGVNMGSLDFQNKISKMFSYILQSFRSMNLGIMFNLPYLSMLNSQARHLMHYSGESMGVDHQTKQNKCKFFFHQVNQSTGKIYKKYPIVQAGSKSRKMKRISYSLPAQYLIDGYEERKQKYLLSLTKKFSETIDEMEEKKKKPDVPKEWELNAYRIRQAGKKQREIALIVEKDQSTVSKGIIKASKWLALGAPS